LTWGIRQDKSLPTFEGEEDKEGEVVASFGGVADMIKETKMIVGTKGVVIVGHDIGEGVRYISTSDDSLGFPGLVCQQYEGEDNATNEKPFASVKGDIDTTIGILTLCKDFVGPV
jgi:hypothetical protein